MSDLRQDVQYATSHEWVRRHDDDVVWVGISDHAQAQLGDIVFVELPEVGRELSQSEECAVVESVKAASDIYSPVNGTVVAVNEALEDQPEQINESPYDDGWLFQVRLSSEPEQLLSADEYHAHISDDE